MKKLFTSMLCVFIAIPLFLTVWGFALPAQYSNTFVGELPAKRALLAAESDKPRLILVGGSAAAFGVDSALLARELPDYQPVNFGLYAALGTRVMLDLSIKELRTGDLVVIMPEQQRQALSDTVGADAFWQAVDGDFSALACLHARDFGPLLGAFPRFAGAKFRYFLTGAPSPDGVYRRGSFNAVGDVVNPLCSANILPDGYDTTMPVRFDPSMLDTDFCDALNAYTAQAESVGAVVLYHFPPMNVLAVENSEDIDTYADYLQSQLTAPLAGDPHACVMDAGWFYDTNFHLNVSGKTVFTRQLIRDLKAVLGDTSSTEIALPAMPARRIQTDTEAANNSDAAYFAWESDRLVVNAAGRGRRTLTGSGRGGRPTRDGAGLRHVCGMQRAGKTDDTAKYHGASGWTFCQMLRAAGNHADPAGPRAAFRGAGPARRCARVLPHPRARRKLHLLLPELRMVALRGDLRPLRQHRAIPALPHRRAAVYTDSRIVEKCRDQLA